MFEICKCKNKYKNLIILICLTEIAINFGLKCANILLQKWNFDSSWVKENQ